MSSSVADGTAGARRWYQRVWQRRGALAHALVLIAVIAAMLALLDRMLIAQWTEDAHTALLDEARRLSRLAQSAQRSDAAFDPQVLQERVDQALNGRDDLLWRVVPSPTSSVSSASSPSSTSSEVRSPRDDPDRARIQRRSLPDGDVDVLPLTIGADRTAALSIELMRPVAGVADRQARFRGVLLGLGLGGVAIVVALTWLGARRAARRLRRLSRDAQRLADGGRLSTADVDAELLPLVSAFNATLDELQAAYRQSEGFSADVAHELRSPLATLIGGTQFVLSRPRSIEALREALASNLEELESLKHLVNDMLFLARADRGERAQSLQRTDLGELADATIDYCAALFEEAGLAVHRVGSATAVCNAALIRRAIANLLSNACQHAGGDRRVILHLEAVPGRVRIWVFNAGDPLTAEVIGRMFDRFYRANAARSGHGAHHGLGLAIVQAVARMHGGSVFARARADGNEIGLEIPGALASAQRRVRDRVHEPGL